MLNTALEDAISSMMAEDDNDPIVPQATVAEPADTTGDDDAIAAFTGTENIAEEDQQSEVQTDDQDTEIKDDTAQEPVKPEYDKLTKAIESKDPKAFVEALGDVAPELLGGKAHKTLRLMVKDAQKANKEAADTYAKAEKVGQLLDAKYGDAIKAREAADKGNVDAFVELIEKWAGNDWNEIQRWVAKGITGRNERLVSKKAEAEQATKAQTEQQVKAANEAKDWIKTKLQVSDKQLLESCPEIVDLVFDEFKVSFDKGVRTVREVLPAAKKKLEDRYLALHKVFGNKTQTPTKKAPSPAAKSPRADKNTRPKTLAEIIAETIAEDGSR
jgi:hypothetical protein